jgi:hypothetical protein
VQVVRAKVSALRAVIFFGWRGESRNRYRIGWFANVDHPGALDLVRAVIRNALIGHDDKVAFR